MNFIHIAGHLGADPETRFTPKGLKVTTLRIATNSYKAGKDETIWWRVTLWGDRFDKLLPHLKKGSAIMVGGDMQKPEIYVDKEGRSNISLEITAEFIRFNPFGKSERSPDQSGQSSYGKTSPQQSHDSGFGEQTFGSSHGTSSSNGGGYGTSSNHFGGDSKIEEEDPIPF